MRTSTEMSFQYPTQSRDSLVISPDVTPRFSVNSNLMNYSIPSSNNKDESTKKYSTLTPLKDMNNKREIQRGDSDTRTRQLEAQIEQLTLQNVKLQRTNRLLKVDTDNLIEQKTSPLEKTIQELTVANVRLQRASKLLQQELDEKTNQLNIFKQNQILQMKSIGPEYEFLLQTINLLQRQISGHPTCDDTCCFTMKPIDQSTMVMTLPSPENEEEEEVEAQHICRPVIHSTISQGSYAVELENKIIRLEQLIDELDQEKEQIIRQQSYKDNDVETLKKELRIKDEIVSQLEQDFMGLEDQIEHLQKELQDQTMYSSNGSSTTGISSMNRLLTPPPAPPMIQRDPKRQSQMLMESKRRSLAIKDTDLLEQMLRGDLEGFEQYQPSEGEEEEESEEEDLDVPVERSNITSAAARSMTPATSTILIQQEEEIEEEEEQEQDENNKKGTAININNTACCLTCNGFPCTFPSCNNHLPTTLPSTKSHQKEKNDDPFTLFTGVTIILGIASQLGISDDWTVPITLATLVSGFLYSSAGKKTKKN